jgi:hypothetical protein
MFCVLDDRDILDLLSFKFCDLFVELSDLGLFASRIQLKLTF